MRQEHIEPENEKSVVTFKGNVGQDRLVLTVTTEEGLFGKVGGVLFKIQRDGVLSCVFGFNDVEHWYENGKEDPLEVSELEGLEEVVSDLTTTSKAVLEVWGRRNLTWEILKDQENSGNAFNGLVQDVESSLEERRS